MATFNLNHGNTSWISSIFLYNPPKIRSLKNPFLQPQHPPLPDLFRNSFSNKIFSNSSRSVFHENTSTRTLSDTKLNYNVNGLCFTYRAIAETLRFKRVEQLVFPLKRLQILVVNPYIMPEHEPVRHSRITIEVRHSVEQDAIVQWTSSQVNTILKSTLILGIHHLQRRHVLLRNSLYLRIRLTSLQYPCQKWQWECIVVVDIVLTNASINVRTEPHRWRLNIHTHITQKV